VSRAETFVVHIYRRAGKRRFAGVVEVVRDGMWHRFASFEDLRGIFEREAFPGHEGTRMTRRSCKPATRRPPRVP
jgi:hypothetical protein